MKYYKVIVGFSVAVCLIVLPWRNVVEAQSRGVLSSVPLDARGAHEVTICSQNLHNYGIFKDVKRQVDGMNQAKLRKQTLALAARFEKAQCDIIAFQELLGKPGMGLEKGLNQLQKELQKDGRKYDFVYGDGEDKYTRVGYLYATNVASEVKRTSYRRVELPRFVPEDRPQSFGRAPLEVEFLIKGDKQKRITLVNIHFKSQAGSQGDPAQLDWETVRIQMAEAVRRVLNAKVKQNALQPFPIIIVLGDRNSHFNSASALVLQGRLNLKDFEHKGPCRLSSKAVPLCKGQPGRAQQFTSVLTTDPQTKLVPGTHYFKNEASWLDDILLSSNALKYAWSKAAREGDYDSGVIMDPKEASDHALTYVRLNW
jgi:endonuclease/exonuclease/phosphatase family metal-dependent hydrolase